MSLLAPGTLFAGHRIEAAVGRGGMGVVYRARQLELDRVVAVKVIKPELLDDPQIRRRFLQEARTAAKIDHPNVIPLHYAGVEDDVAYIVMRYVDGADVHRLVRREGPLAIGRAAQIAAQVGEALDAIHSAGYVHRDVKPANVLVAPGDHVYLTDFGLAKQTVTRTDPTRTGQWVGTLDYAPPEQIRGGRIDARADVYSLGGVLYYMLTARPPFDRAGDEAKMYAHLVDAPPAPTKLRPDAPPQFDAVVRRAMAKLPSERYPSAGDLGRAALSAAHGGSAAPERMVATGRAAPEGAVTEPGMAEASTLSEARTAVVHRRPRRALWAGAALAVAAAAATAAALLLPQNDEEHPQARAAKASPPTPRVGPTIRNVGRRPNAIAAAGGGVWAVSFTRNRLTRIDAASSRKVPGGPVVGVGGADIAAAGEDLWLANSRSREVIRIDARNGRVNRRLHLTQTPRGVAAGERDLWIAAVSPPGRTTDTILRYDRDARHRRDEIHVTRGVQALVAGDGGLWFAEKNAPRIRHLDARTRQITTVARLPEPAYDLTAGEDYLWATVETRGTVERIDPRSGERTTIPAGPVPRQLVATGGWVFVAVNGEHVVRVIDPDAAVVSGRALPVGLNPFAIAAADHHVWVTGQSEDTVTRIDY